MIGSTPALPTGRSGPGVEGGPVTLNFNSHMALANNKVGVGIIAVQDQSDKCFSSESVFTYSTAIPLYLIVASMLSDCYFCSGSGSVNGVLMINDPRSSFSEAK